MAARLPSEVLYKETMEAARGEVQELTNEIRHLRERLGQLETRKEAVGDLYNAVRRLVELEDGEMDEATVEYEAIGLSEEEVSLIAYSDGNGRNRQA